MLGKSGCTHSINLKTPNTQKSTHRREEEKKKIVEDKRGERRELRSTKKR